MLNLKFTIDDKFLATHTIANHGQDRFVPYAKPEDLLSIVKFRDKAFKISEDYYYIFTGRYPIYQYSIFENKQFDVIGKDLNEYVSQLTSTEEFKILRNETSTSIDSLENEWRSNFEITNALLNELNLMIDGEFIVYITHPLLQAGQYFGNNRLHWSYMKYWENYNTVYLLHELLHSVFRHDDISHSVIELISNNEMRVRLNGGEYPPFEGHEYLNKTKEMIIDDWRKFLQSENKNVIEFTEKLIKKYQ